MSTSSSGSRTPRHVLVIVAPWGVGRASDATSSGQVPGPAPREEVDQPVRERFRERVRRPLADALGVDVRHVQWSHDDHGGAVLAGLPWRVSVSHTTGTSVLAVHDQPVGVDVERDDLGTTSARRLAARFTQEQRDRAAGPDGTVDRTTVAALWVRKEAVVKAARRGLDAGVGRLVVPLGAPPRAEWCEGHLGRWFVQDVQHPGFLIAVATSDEVGVEQRMLDD